MRATRALSVLLALALQGCVFVPRTTDVYDADCRITSKQMQLEPVQVAAFGGCTNNECAALLVFVGATAAVSAIVSGSIVVVGNIAYWFEKQGRCNPSPRTTPAQPQPLRENEVP